MILAGVIAEERVSGGGGAAPTLVQVNGNPGSGGGFGTIVFPGAVTLGNAIFLYASLVGGTTLNLPTDSSTGGGSPNTWVLISGPDSSPNDGTPSGLGTGAHSYLWACWNVVSNPGTIQINRAGGGFPICSAAEVHGATAVDVQSFRAQNASTSWAGSGLTTTGANRLLISFMSDFDGNGHQSWTAGAGWTSQLNVNDGAGFAGDGLFIETQTAIASGSYSDTATVSLSKPGSIESIALRA